MMLKNSQPDENDRDIDEFPMEKDHEEVSFFDFESINSPKKEFKINEGVRNQMN